MKLFIDSADPEEIRTAWSWGWLDGVTTNPSLAAKLGRPYPDIVHEILALVDEHASISLEVVATDTDGMVAQGKRLAKLDPRVAVKCPCTSDGLRATKALSKAGIKVNMTLVFSAAQALLAAKAGAYFVSPFVGRLDDIQESAGDEVVSDIIDIYENYGFATQILYASVRDTEHVVHAALLGADIATVPFAILENLAEHQLTDKGLDRFLEDWNSSGLQLP